MLAAWLPRLLVPIAVSLAYALFRQLAPPRARMASHRYDESQVPERLAAGLIASAMWSLGFAIAALFFVFRGANHLWVDLEGPSLVTQYAPQVYWCFLPGFAAISVPWPLTVWYLRRVGRWEEADGIEDRSDSKGGFNSFQVMKWLNYVFIGPLAVATALAIPIHLSVTDSQIRVGHYASFQPERFSLKDATGLTIVTTIGVHGSQIEDVIVEFSNGHRLRGNQVGDGGSSIRSDVKQILIKETGLSPRYSALTK